MMEGPRFLFPKNPMEATKNHRILKIFRDMVMGDKIGTERGAKTFVCCKVSLLGCKLFEINSFKLYCTLMSYW